MTQILSSILDKKQRRTKAEIEGLKSILFRIVEEEKPTTIRHLFYRMVAAGAIEKTEREYQNVVIRLASEMRMNEELPFDWIADNSRYTVKPRSFNSIEDMIEDSAKAYRKNLWNNSDSYVEIWTEKDAIRAALSPVTWEYDVPLMICRGQASISFLWISAENAVLEEKPVYIYLLTDFDRSGYLIDENIQRKLRDFYTRIMKRHYDFTGAKITPEQVTELYLHFERLAVTESQIREFNLPTRPPKEHEKNGFSENVELDAMNTNDLRALVQNAIERHLPREELERLKQIEASEREQFERFSEVFKNRAGENVNSTSDRAD